MKAVAALLMLMLAAVASAAGQETVATGLTAIDNIVLGNKGVIYATQEHRAPAGRLISIREGKIRVLLSGLNRPDGLVRQGHWLYITEEVSNGRLIRYDLRNGKWTVLAMLDHAEGIVVEPDGSVLVAIDDARGSIIRIHNGKRKVLVSGLKRPEGICRAVDGSLVIAETASGRLLAWRDGRLHVLARGLKEPDQVLCASDGSILVGEDANPGRVWRYHRGKLNVMLSALQAPQGMRLDHEGYLYIAEQARGRIVRARTTLRPVWQQLEAGLELGRLLSPVRSPIGDSVIHVLRIDPAFFRFQLMNASADRKGKPMSARAWVFRRNKVAAINASMYQADHRTSVSYMRRHGHTNNRRVSRDNSFLVFDPVKPGLPAVRLVDRECDNIDEIRRQYRTVIQSIRMVSCKGKNVWSLQNKRWSTALIAQDQQGRILFIHVRSPFRTHKLINALLALPLGISRAMYVEGGPEAQLFINSRGGQFHFIGSFETGFNENNLISAPWPIPNVVTISRRR
jgi:sugar lactone lactonase YvrE